MACVITATITAVLATIVFVVVQIAVCARCKCRSERMQEGHEYEQVDTIAPLVEARRDRINAVQMEANEAYTEGSTFNLDDNTAYRKGNAFHVQQNEAYDRQL